MPCCDGDKPCGGPAYHVDPDDAAYAEAQSRYPTVSLDRGNWASSANGTDQFADYDDGLVRGQDELAEAAEAPFLYTGEHLHACNFPLGSFGTGRVLLCGDGCLKEWTVVNQCRTDDGGPGDAPQPLADMPANFFAISATPQGGSKQTYALVTPQNYTAANVALPPRREAHVSQHEVRRLQTIPGIKGLTMRCTYPIAEVDYEIPGLPVVVSMEALSPAIPQDEKASCLPVAIFQFTVKNSGTKPVEVSLAEFQQNFIGWDGKLDCSPGKTSQWAGNVNTPYQSADKAVAGLSMSTTNPKVTPTTPDIFGTICVSGAVSPTNKVQVITQATDEEDLFAQFAAGKFQPTTAPPTPPSAAGTSWCGACVQTVTVAAGATTTVDFYLTWHFPNRSAAGSGATRPGLLPKVLGNYYDNLYSDAEAVAAGVHKQIGYLRGTTRDYTRALFESTVPPDLLDSAAGRLAVARSATMWWTKAGIVLGCEGNGCCPLNCSHVYGYATLLERLHPEWAKDMSFSAFVRTWEPATGCSMRYGSGGW
jgi:non-lysosomal glucosylceramidase